ncbi:MAG TPA: hypothetical protein VHA06_17010 [Candidatus Angelobacter sp.]|jgi:hypothetical protein|nr:hypothetical protein [Candidatus Angelobacter sp.]
MDPESKTQADSSQLSEPVQHVARAHQLLKGLSEKFGLEKHPELQEAITTLELALNKLTIDTGGMF